MALLVRIVLLVFVIYFIDLGYSKKRSYDGFKLLEVSLDDKHSAGKLQAIEAQDEQISFWNFPRRLGDKAVILVEPDHYEKFANTLKKLNLDFTVAQEDLGRLINEEEQAMATQSRLATDDEFDLYNYHQHDEINGFLKELVGRCNENPALRCKKIAIGRSYEGRKMLVIKIGARGKHNQPAVWIDAGIHAREWIAPATALYIMNKLISTYDSRNETKAVVNAFDWYILPVVNPDGYEYTWTDERLWRKTRSPNANSDCVGTDPNRNWDFHWNEAGTSEWECSDIYAGPSPFSEIETRNMAKFLQKDKNFEVYISLHSFGQYWLTPWGYTDAEVPDNYDELVALGNTGAEAIASVYGSEYTVGSAAIVLYAASGSSMDWAKVTANITYSLAAELRDTGYHGFVLPPSEIRPVGKETYKGIRTMMLKVARDLGYIR